MSMEDGDEELFTTFYMKPDAKTVLIEISLNGELLAYQEGESTRLVESSIRLKYGIEGGCLQRNSKVYLGTTLFKPASGPCVYVFVGGNRPVSKEEHEPPAAVNKMCVVDTSVVAPVSATVVPGMGWTRNKSRKCPCCV